MGQTKVKSLLRYVKDLKFYKDSDFLSNHFANVMCACAINIRREHFLISPETPTIPGSSSLGFVPGRSK